MKKKYLNSNMASARNFELLGNLYVVKGLKRRSQKKIGIRNAFNLKSLAKLLSKKRRFID